MDSPPEVIVTIVPAARTSGAKATAVSRRVKANAKSRGRARGDMGSSVDASSGQADEHGARRRDFTTEGTPRRPIAVHGRLALRQADELPRVPRSPALDRDEVDPGGERMARLVATVERDIVIAGLDAAFDEPAHQAAARVVDRQRHVAGPGQPG